MSDSKQPLEHVRSIEAIRAKIKDNLASGPGNEVIFLGEVAERTPSVQLLPEARKFHSEFDRVLAHMQDYLEKSVHPAVAKQDARAEKIGAALGQMPLKLYEECNPRKPATCYPLVDKLCAVMRDLEKDDALGSNDIGRFTLQQMEHFVPVKHKEDPASDSTATLNDHTHALKQVLEILKKARETGMMPTPRVTRLGQGGVMVENVDRPLTDKDRLFYPSFNNLMQLTYTYLNERARTEIDKHKGGAHAGKAIEALQHFLPHEYSIVLSDPGECLYLANKLKGMVNALEDPAAIGSTTGGAFLVREYTRFFQAQEQQRT